MLARPCGSSYNSLASMIGLAARASWDSPIVVCDSVTYLVHESGRYCYLCRRVADDRRVMSLGGGLRGEGFTIGCFW